MRNNNTKKKKRILFALGNYYPIPSANGICVQRIIEELQRRDYEVECVVNDAGNTGNSIIANAVRLTFVQPPLAWVFPETISKQKKPVLKEVLKIIQRLYMYARIPLYLASFPSISNRYSNKIRDAILDHVDRDKKNTVAIIGVNKPVEALEGACKAALQQQIPFVAYFLDPLVGGYSNRVVGKKRSFEKTLSLENKILEHSDLAIYMDEHKWDFIKRHGNSFNNKTVFLGAPLLENNMKSMPRKSNERSGKKTIIYAGAVYKDIRNPEYMMEVFKHVKTATLIMYVTNPEEWVLQLSNPNIDIRGRVSHETVVQEIKESDGVLNIGNSNPIFAPSKIIEYIGFGKPIITSYRIDEDSSLKYMNQYPKALCIDERSMDVKEAAAAIDAFMNRHNDEVSYEQLESIYHKNTPAAVADEIEKIIKA